MRLVGEGPPPSVTAVLVEDPAAGARTAAALVRGGVELVGRAALPADAVSVVAEHHPDVVVVDLDGGSGALSAVGSVAAASPQVPLLALSSAADHATVLDAVRAGATSVLVASARLGELVDAVRRTAAGQAVFSPGLADIALEGSGRPLDPADGARRLTEREVDVLRLVVDGLTARQIAARLVLSPRTVENHVQNMLRKLRLQGRAALVRYAIENGLA